MNNTLHFDYMARKLRNFFHSKGFVEVPAAYRFSILAACEDPKTITTYEMGGNKWPLPQTGQMWLEVELLKNPTWTGVFCLGPSYRNEPNPIPGRHNLLFPMFDFEGRGTHEDLHKIEAELLQYLGFETPTPVSYEDACAKYESNTIEATQEELLGEEVSSAILLHHFPWRANPYWNMKHIGNNIFAKTDVLLYGVETIGSAERSSNKEEMREFFFGNSDGQYAELLFKHFGKDRVMKEFDAYLSYDMPSRFGGGIGMTRLELAMTKAGLFESIDTHYQMPQQASYSQAQV